MFRMWWTVVIVIMGVVLAVVAVSVILLCCLCPWLKYDVQFVHVMSRPLLIYSKLRRRNVLLFDLFERQAQLKPKKTFLIFQDTRISYDQAQEQVNKTAHVALRLGLKRDDTVAILMHNGPGLVFVYLGLAKMGIRPAFLNTNLPSKALLHCIDVSGARTLIVGEGEELVAALQEIHPELQASGIAVYTQSQTTNCGFKSFDKLLELASSAPIGFEERPDTDLSDVLCYIFTSGTTGLPKAAVVSHAKALKATTFMEPFKGSAADVIYSPLPLYHSAALLIALGSTIRMGATMVIRRKFSATNYWEDCRRYEVTITQYIGELCRYLLARPPSPLDRDHKVRVAIGNGLRLDIWQQFQERFAVPQIGEYYAATECNVVFYNFFHKLGAVGRMSPVLRAIYPVYFLKYDYNTAQPIRGRDGFCILAKNGEPGLMVSKIKRNMEFDGYRGEEMTESKILRDVFSRGDAYYNSGDLFVRDAEYFLYFSDRIGDTFRWKGENVSTVEVSNVLADIAWIEDATVYGVTVPGQEGRAGMAGLALAADQQLSTARLHELYCKCTEGLPSYARPRFLRFSAEFEMTGTLKHCKGRLVKEGFDPNKCQGEPLYCMDSVSQTYIPLDEQVFQQILAGEIRL